MRFLSNQDLAGLLSPTALIEAMERGLRDLARGAVLVPHRQHVDFAGNTLLTMPVVGADLFGTKIVSVFPANAARNERVTNGLMVVCDGATGVPVAALNAAALTAQRTSAVGALALKYTTPPAVDRIGIIGTGVQGTWQAIFAGSVRNIRTVYFLARSEASARKFVDDLARELPEVKCIRCTDARELLAEVPVIIAATTSSMPVVPGERALLENKHFISVGSFKPAMRELPSAVYELADQVLVDSDVAKSEVGDLIEPIASGRLREDKIHHLAELVGGGLAVDVERTTAFKSVGMALYDLYAAAAFVAAAEVSGRGTVVDL